LSVWLKNESKLHNNEYLAEDNEKKKF